MKRKRGRPKKNKVRRHVYWSKQLDEVIMSKFKPGELSAFVETAIRFACGARGWRVPPADCEARSPSE